MNTPYAYTDLMITFNFPVFAICIMHHIKYQITVFVYDCVTGIIYRNRKTMIWY